ncbi:MAG: alginate O-acetyltransferase AlgF [Spirochaetia bacterium]
MTRVLIGLFGVFLAAAPLAAQDEGLYGSKAPEDAAFVRIINSGTDTLPRLPVGAVRFARLAPLEVSPYKVLTPGVLIIKARDGQVDIAAGAREYYTVAVSDAGPKVFQDRRHDDPLKAQLILYNLTDISPINLKTADGGSEVISGVQAGESASIAVNPVRTGLSLFEGEKELETAGSVDMEAGQSYGIFAVDHSGELKIFVEQAEVAAE